MALKHWLLCPPVTNVNDRLNRFVHCWYNWWNVLPEILAPESIWRQTKWPAVKHRIESRTDPWKPVRTTSYGRYWCSAPERQHENWEDNPVEDVKGTLSITDRTITGINNTIKSAIDNAKSKPLQYLLYDCPTTTKIFNTFFNDLSRSKDNAFYFNEVCVMSSKQTHYWQSSIYTGEIEC